MGYGVLIALLALWPSAAFAHTLAQQVILPLPISFYIAGGVAAFAVSCFFLAFMGKTTLGRERVYVLPKAFGSSIEIVLQTVFLISLLGGIGFGLFGSQSGFFNPLPYMFWVGLVLVLPYLSVMLSGIWEVGNPFRALLSLISWPLPKGKSTWRLGYLPAVLLYAGLLILELFFPKLSMEPRFLGGLLIAYAFYLVVGSFLYGARDWFRYAEVFTVFMRLAGKLAPLRLEEGRVALFSPAARLVIEQPRKLSLVFFILAALAATAYDGFRETKVALDLILDVLQTPWVLTQFSIFALFVLGFCLLYAGTILFLKVLVRGRAHLSTYMLRFAYSLVPIMLAYHFAHYFTLIFTTFNITVNGAAVWYTQLGVIVLGHAFAAYVAHQIALVEFRTKWKAFVSQIPLMLLMVFYTAFGLWILAQPFAS